MQNRTFLVLLRPIFCEKLKLAPPPIGKQPPSNVGISEFGRKISLNFGEDLFFFLETTWFWAEKTFEFLSFRWNFVSIFGQTVWNWFKNNENSGQGRLHFSHSFKKAPPFPNPSYAPGNIAVTNFRWLQQEKKLGCIPWFVINCNHIFFLFHNIICLCLVAANGLFDLRVKLQSAHLPVYLTWCRLHTIPFNYWTSSRVLWIPIFTLFDLARPEVESESTVSVADALYPLSTELLSFLLWQQVSPSYAETFFSL